MTTKKRRTTRSRTTTSRSRSSRSGYPRRRTRRWVSPASSLGTAVGVAVAAGLIALLGGLPWWGWLLLVVVGVAAAGIWAVSRRRGEDAEPDTEPDTGGEPVPPADGRGATGT